jgi:anti-anti-sigma regulatory factor
MPPNEPSGLLSKVVKFVRNPTTNWSDLDQPEADKESQYSKQMLKEMIERKRRNDFVRRREFDQLRKLRQNGAQAPSADAVERPSFFQSSMQSMQSKLDDRAGTIKKIDEIEEQMSRQWWKAKDATGGKPAVPMSHRAALLPTEPMPFAAVSPQAFAPTLPSPLSPTAIATSFAPTEVTPLREDVPRVEPMVDMLAALDSRINFSADEQEAGGLGEVEFVHIAELDEAAIRFANGDTTTVEVFIQTLLRGEYGADRHSEVWAALFDFYRATDQADKFDVAAIDFATRFGRSAPNWFSIPEQAGRRGVVSAPVPDVGHEFNWTSPSLLGATTVANLRLALQRGQPARIQMDWSHLESIDGTALEGLCSLLDSWTQQAVRLSFLRIDRLEAVVQGQARTGDAGVNQAWWRLRLDLLRILRNHDAFDMVALEYCITYEVSPPSWQDVRCTSVVLVSQDEEIVPGAPLSRQPADSMFKHTDTGVSDSISGMQHMGLSGLVLGDAMDALAKVDNWADGSSSVVVPCDYLVRIDFSAAGSVLNWAALHHAAGRSVRFTGLHRLAAIFFNIVGINEHAKVIPRRN